MRRRHPIRWDVCADAALAEPGGLVFWVDAPDREAAVQDLGGTVLDAEGVVPETDGEALRALTA